jgi:hypothetical protein
MSDIRAEDFRSISITKNNANNGAVVEYGEEVVERGEFRANFSFQGTKDEVSSRKTIRRDIYTNATIYGSSLREILEESLKYVIENNIK